MSSAFARGKDVTKNLVGPSIPPHSVHVSLIPFVAVNVASVPSVKRPLLHSAVQPRGSVSFGSVPFAFAASKLVPVVTAGATGAVSFFPSFPAVQASLIRVRFVVRALMVPSWQAEVMSD